MIDVEIDIFDQVATAILEEYPEAYISSEYVEAPPQFPAVSIVESHNITNQSTEDSSLDENASILTYSVNIYSNSAISAKQDCKGILNVLNDKMHRLNMTRTMCSVVDNARDPTVYRMSATYMAVVDKHNRLYRI